MADIGNANFLTYFLGGISVLINKISSFALFFSHFTLTLRLRSVRIGRLALFQGQFCSSANSPLWAYVYIFVVIIASLFIL